MKRIVPPLLLALLCQCATARPEIARDLRGELPPESADACVTVIALFATWCLPCIAQLDVLRALQEKLGPRGLVVEAIALDLEGEEVVGPFREQAHLPFTIRAAQPGLREGQSVFGPISGLPSTFVVDAQGQALTAFEGAARVDVLEDALKSRVAAEPRTGATGLKRLSCPR